MKWQTICTWGDWWLNLRYMKVILLTKKVMLWNLKSFPFRYYCSSFPPLVGNNLAQPTMRIRLKKYFGNAIFSSYEINSWKPEPDIFLFAAKKMGVHPHECLVIEDSMKGIESALKAGMKTILFDPMHRFDSINGVHKIDTMNKVKEILSVHNQEHQ